MSPGQLKKIFLALGLLFLAYAGVRLLGGDDGRASGGRDIGAAVSADVDLIRVSGPGEDGVVELARSGESWTVNGYPADTALVREAIAGMDTARMGRLVARSAANHARLGVADDSARRVEIGPASARTISFLLGNRGLEGLFVRFPGEDEVYVVARESLGMLDRAADDWRDAVVAAVDTAAVIRIAIRRTDEEQPTVLSRSLADSAAGAWLENGVPADSSLMQGLLELAADLRAEGFPSDSVAFAVDFESPVAVLEMYDSDDVGAPPGLSLLFLTAPDARDFLVRRAENPLVYRLSAIQADQLLPARARLFAETP